MGKCVCIATFSEEAKIEMAKFTFKQNVGISGFETLECHGLVMFEEKKISP